MTRIGLVGARGYVGEELIRLIDAHPHFTLGFVSSRARAGERVADHIEGIDSDLVYRHVTPDALADEAVDAYVLALPNGMAADYVAALDVSASGATILDLSADYRFDDDWYYALPELQRWAYRGQTRISNPGCYATAMQLAIAPLADRLAGPVQCFGVSGYSGAGTTPSDKNDPAKLADNLIPYALAGHLHEREVTRHCAPVEFMPHVAPHFRGLSITANLHLTAPIALADVRDLYADFYRDEPLIALSEDAPWLSRIAGRPGATIGGFTVSSDGRRVVVVSVLDNLLKGAASQALQNLNRAFGHDEFTGIMDMMGATA